MKNIGPFDSNFTITADNKLSIKSVNPQIKYLKDISVLGIFENPIHVEQINNPETINNTVDKLDYKFPLESKLITQLVDIVVKNLVGGIYAPEDKINNGNDVLSETQVNNKK